jgi:outer membrane protein assembly factor BamB
VHYGGSSFNPGTGLLYVAGKDSPIFMTAIPVGATLKIGQFSTAGRREDAAPATGNVSAYDPATLELTWRTTIAGGPSAGTFTTAGNLVFVGDRQGTFYAFDARKGTVRHGSLGRYRHDVRATWPMTFQGAAAVRRRLTGD